MSKKKAAGNQVSSLLLEAVRGIHTLLDRLSVEQMLSQTQQLFKGIKRGRWEED